MHVPGKGYLRIDSTTQFASCSSGTGATPAELFYVQARHRVLNQCGLQAWSGKGAVPAMTCTSSPNCRTPSTQKAPG
jgi:hypothetical protein